MRSWLGRMASGRRAAEPQGTVSLFQCYPGSHSIVVWRHCRIPHPDSSSAPTLSTKRTSFTNFFMFARPITYKQLRGRVIMKAADAATYVIFGLLLLRHEPREVWM
jgi:hypothetical protein